MDLLEFGVKEYLDKGNKILNFGQICQGMLRSLEEFHKRGYLHRDVKPENFRVHNNRVYLIDFGMYREWKQNGVHIPYTAGKQFKGTPLTSSIFTHQSIE
jgi:serine/threonine protein kinase